MEPRLGLLGAASVIDLHYRKIQRVASLQCGGMYYRINAVGMADIRKGPNHLAV